MSDKFSLTGIHINPFQNMEDLPSENDDITDIMASRDAGNVMRKKQKTRRFTSSTIVTVATCNLNQWALDFTGNLERVRDATLSSWSCCSMGCD